LGPRKSFFFFFFLVFFFFPFPAGGRCYTRLRGCAWRLRLLHTWHRVAAVIRLSPTTETLESARPIRFEAVGRCRRWATTHTEWPNRLASFSSEFSAPIRHSAAPRIPLCPRTAATCMVHHGHAAAPALPRHAPPQLSLYLARPPARLHRSLSRQLAPARARKWQGSEQSSLHDGRTRSRLRRRHPAMQTRLNMVIPPRSADSPSSADSPNSADLPSSGDDAGGEDVVGWRRPPRVAVRKVSMRKRGQPSSSRGTPSNIGVKQSSL
jgi:hypothetical protein